MSNDLNVLISAKLNIDKSVKQINSQIINNLQKKLENINLNIDIDKSIIQTINKFADAVSKANNIIDDNNKVIKKEEEILRNLDGTVKKVTRLYMKNNEVREHTQVIHDKNIKALEKESAEIEKLTKDYGKLIKVTEQQNANKETIGKALTFRDAQGIETTAYFKQGQESAYKIVNNIDKIQKAEEKAQKEIKEAIIETEQKRRKELEKSIQEQSKYINKNLENNYKLQRAEELRIKRLGDLKKSGISDESFEGNYERVRASLEKYIKSIYGVESKIKQLTRTIDANGHEIWKYTTNLDRGQSEFEEFKGSIDRTTKSIYQFSSTLKKNHARDLGMIRQLGIALQRVPLWGISTGLIYGSKRQVEQGISFISEIDKELTNLRKVADEGIITLRNYVEEAGNIGIQFGKTTPEVIRATVAFSRLGYSLEQSSKLAQETLLYANVGDMEIEEATKAILSTIKGFGIVVDEQGKNVRRIVDLFNNIGNNFAISSAGKIMPLMLVTTY